MLCRMSANTVRAARNRRVAPSVAAMTFQTVPNHRPNRNPPEMETTAATGSENVTQAA